MKNSVMSHDITEFIFKLARVEPLSVLEGCFPLMLR